MRVNPHLHPRHRRLLGGKRQGHHQVLRRRREPRGQRTENCRRPLTGSPDGRRRTFARWSLGTCRKSPINSECGCALESTAAFLWELAKPISRRCDRQSGRRESHLPRQSRCRSCCSAP
jgi:hypothetical protein